MEDKTYNGWTNYETWVTKLWMDNDQGSQEHYAEMARDFQEADKHNTLTGQSSTCYDLSEALQEEFEEFNPVQEASVYSDLMNAALSEVNWYEIAKSLIEDNPIESKERDNA